MINVEETEKLLYSVGESLKSFQFQNILSLVYLSLLSVHLEWSHLYRICQLGLVNVFFVAEKVLLVPNHDAHANEREKERVRGWGT